MRVLIPLPDRDFDVTEVAVPWRLLREAGHQVVFATEHAGTVPAADPRLLTGVILGQLGAAPQARDFYAELVKAPEFTSTISWADLDPSAFDGLLLPGGHAPGMRQYLGSPVLQQQVARFWSLGRPVAAICHGVLVLARTRDPATGRSVLAGRQTTCLPKYMERSAWLATAWRLGRYYRTYPAYVQDEVEATLDDPHRQFRRGPRTLSARGTATDDTAAFVVADRNYLSARWPGDAYLFGRRFCDLLQAAGSPEASSPDTSNPDTSAQWITAAELAGRAAAAAMASPDVTPGQWVYRRNAVVAVPEQADRPVSTPGPRDDADAAGNRGAGFLLAGAAGGNQEILISPETYRFRGYQFLGEGRDIRSGSGWGIAVLRQDLVSEPGVRPAGL